MPTKSQLHSLMAADFEFKMNARDGLGSEHADHISRRPPKTGNGKVIGEFWIDENKEPHIGPKKENTPQIGG